MQNDQGFRDRPTSDDLRTIVAKWQLTTDLGDQLDADGQLVTGDSSHESFDRAWAALLTGRLDEAESEFESSATSRGAAQDFVGWGDVFATRGNWQRAAELYEQALRTAPDDPVARVGMAQAMVATGRAEIAVAKLERLVGERDDRLCRHYLASALWSWTTQARSMTRDRVLFIANEHQLDICASAARRIVELEPSGTELGSAAGYLLDEITEGGRWKWDRVPVAGTLATLVALVGIAAVVFGGLAGNIPLVVAAVLGAPLLLAIVIRFRRPVWRVRAEQLRPRVWYEGVTG
ncbi:MAG: tetratricopeptide repeat protein [Sciscionella sp.]